MSEFNQGAASGKLVHSSLLSFLPGVSREARDDILLANAFAQQVAWGTSTKAWSRTGSGTTGVTLRFWALMASSRPRRLDRGRTGPALPIRRLPRFARKAPPAIINLPSRRFRRCAMTARH